MRAGFLVSGRQDGEDPRRLIFSCLRSLCVLCALCGFSAAWVRADEFSSVSRHSVRLFSYGTLVLDTRVGDVHIEGWDEPRVEIEAEVVCRTRDRRRSRGLRRRVEELLEALAS